MRIGWFLGRCDCLWLIRALSPLSSPMHMVAISALAYSVFALFASCKHLWFALFPFSHHVYDSSLSAYFPLVSRVCARMGVSGNGISTSPALYVMRRISGYICRLGSLGRAHASLRMWGNAFSSFGFMWFLLFHVVVIRVVEDEDRRRDVCLGRIA